MRALLSALRSPVQLLAAAYGFLALAHETVAWQSGLVTKVVGAALVVAVALRIWSDGPAERGGFWVLAVPVAGLAGWSALSLLWSVDPGATRVRALHLGFEAVLLGALCLAPRREVVVRGLAIGLLGGAVVLALGFVSALGEATGARLYAFGVHPNLQARDLALGVLAGGLLLVPDHRRLLGAVAMAGFGLGLSNSSGAWLATVAAGVVLILDRSHRHLVAALLVGVLLGSGALAWAGSAADSRLRSPATALRGSAVEEIGSGRLVLWGHAARMSARNPVLGVGAGAFPAAMEEVRAAYQHAGGEHSKPRRRSHSVYLDLLAETGPLGLLLFLIPLGWAARVAIRERAVAAGALTAFVATSVATDSLLHQKSLWLALALAILLARPAR